MGECRQRIHCRYSPRAHDPSGQVTRTQPEKQIPSPLPSLLTRHESSNPLPPLANNLPRPSWPRVIPHDCQNKPRSGNACADRRLWLQIAMGRNASCACTNPEWLQPGGELPAWRHGNGAEYGTSTRKM